MQTTTTTSTDDVPPPPVLRVPPPPLTHTLYQPESSVLCLAADDEHIFSGTQENHIYVWDRASLQVETTLRGHTESVLALVLAPERKWLFSSSADSTVRIWSTETLSPLSLLLPALDAFSGDIFSLAWHADLSALYLGCQDTSIQFYHFDYACALRDYPNALTAETGTGTSTPERKYHKFFDSQPRFGHAARLDVDGRLRPLEIPNGAEGLGGVGGSTMRTMQVPRENVVPSAHFGYIYCMELVRAEEGGTMLVTGSGDEDVKVWNCLPSGLELRMTLNGDSGGVLSLAVREDTLYAGCQSGFIKVWDLETGTLVRTIIAQENEDVLALTLLGTDLYASSANGRVQRWNGSFEETACWRAHEGSILSSMVVPKDPKGLTQHHQALYEFVSGANDDCIKIWDVERPPELKSSSSSTSVTSGQPDLQADTLLNALTHFISIPSVSNEAHREDCRQAALFLKRTLTQLGAVATILPNQPGHNPVVLGCFQGAKGAGTKPRILFYGHYDVIAASSHGWDSPPFVLTGRNGYLYGRGASDDKGPILAVACAASKLLAKRMLGADVIMLVEGEEEAGSTGFKEVVRKYKDQIGHVDEILVSNSYWIGEDTPCITYGLRGVIHSTVEIRNNNVDMHSGVEGGAVREPMIDMIQLLSSLSSGSQIMIPGFYNRVRPSTTSELESEEKLSEITRKSAANIRSRWREPSLSIHSLGGSGLSNSTVIPHSVRSKVSLRIVPDQVLEDIEQSLVQHIKHSFETLQSPNQLKVTIDHTADWWLGELDGRSFRALESAVEAEWGVRPLRIREGGSIPSIPFLEKEFGCHALHLPMGQSSDQAHLLNERISLKNLHKGQDVVARFLLNLTS